MFITYPDARYLSGCVVPGGGPPALRASLGASTRCPSRPRRPCGGLRPGCGRLGSATSGVAVSHAIPPEYLACSYHFVYLSHSCSGIACDFGEGWCWRVGGMWHGRVVRERDAGERRWACAQVVDGLFMRLLSRPLGVVRIRWGICRRGWCGCGGGCRSLRSRWRPRCRPGRGW